MKVTERPPVQMVLTKSGNPVYVCEVCSKKSDFSFCSDNCTIIYGYCQRLENAIKRDNNERWGNIGCNSSPEAMQEVHDRFKG